MPHYEYRCVANGQTLEVRHGMDERLETWGDVAGGRGTDFQGCGQGCACARRA